MEEHTTRANELRAMVIKEKYGYYAVCLEHYIGAQSATLEEVLARLRVAYRAELDTSMKRTGKPFGGIPPAPKKYHDLYSDRGNTKVIRAGVIWDKNSTLEMAACTLAMAA